MNTETTTEPTTETAAPAYIGTATYSPEDNKLRLYPFERLTPETFASAKAFGFIWAPQQKLFVAPMWTPGRARWLERRCGEIGDEAMSLEERQAQRAERFAAYSEKRANDAERAHDGVSSIIGHIPLGQPILIGHHSEKRARKDAERIDGGMRKAVKLWETSKYWTDRAAAAKAHGKYEERPEVRARRIKRLTLDLKKQSKYAADAAGAIVAWLKEGLTSEEAQRVSDGGPYMTFSFTLEKFPRDFEKYEGAQSLGDALKKKIITVEKAVLMAKAAFQRRLDEAAEWIAHLENRLAYEKAMLADQGAMDLLAKAPRPKQLPLVNYRAASINARRFGEMRNFPMVDMTSEQYQRIYSEQRGTLEVENSHRVRFAFYEKGDNGEPLRFASHVDGKWVSVFLTDSKVHKKPAAVASVPRVPPAPKLMREYTPPARTKFDDMKEQLKTGVKVVQANQLFPAPQWLARRMLSLAPMFDGARVLEPSAGTGAILREMPRMVAGEIVAIEINASLCANLEALKQGAEILPDLTIVNRDFLEFDESWTFDRIYMNPPFERGVDIEHIELAVSMLNPGGICVAICAAGPRQHEKLMPMADTWEELPDGTFSEQGTSVRTILATFSAQ